MSKSKTKYPTLSPMEAGYLVLVVERHWSGEVTGGNWGNKTVRGALLRLGLIDYGEEMDIERQDGRGMYRGHPLVPTDLALSWVEWFHKGQHEPRNYRPRRVWTDEEDLTRKPARVAARRELEEDGP